MIESIRLIYQHKESDKIPSGTGKHSTNCKYQGYGEGIQNKAMKLLDEGVTHRDIAEIVGCSSSSIYQWESKRKNR